MWQGADGSMPELLHIFCAIPFSPQLFSLLKKDKTKLKWTEKAISVPKSRKQGKQLHTDLWEEEKLFAEEGAELFFPSHFLLPAPLRTTTYLLTGNVLQGLGSKYLHNLNTRQESGFCGRADWKYYPTASGTTQKTSWWDVTHSPLMTALEILLLSNSSIKHQTKINNCSPVLVSTETQSDKERNQESALP